MGVRGHRKAEKLPGLVMPAEAPALLSSQGSYESHEETFGGAVNVENPVKFGGLL